MKTHRALKIAALALALCLAFPLAASAGGKMPEVMFILDASGSMWGKAGGQTKIEAAKKVLARVASALPPEVKVGLAAYGHRRKGDCSDVQILTPSGSTDRQGLLQKVAAINPKGKTPLTASVLMVAETLKQKENETTIVLISDGLETCHDDPCGAIRQLKQSGIKFILHVVGFGVAQQGAGQLSCLAKAGGGKYFAAGDEKELALALASVQEQVAVKVAQAKSTVVKAKSGLGKLRLILPPETLKTVGHLNIIRKQDNKVVKKAKLSQADSTHPLLSGRYGVVLGHANPNYKKDTDYAIGDFQINGGQTTVVKLGAVVLNMAKGLGEAVSQIGLRKANGGEFLRVDYVNGYYIFKPKALPAGTYDLFARYSQSPQDTVLAKGVLVKEGGAAVVTLDSGLFLVKPAGSDVVRWDLSPAGGQKPVLVVKRRSDNQFPLWKRFMVPPGSYDLVVYVKGMSEPLPVLQGISIPKGQTIKVETGL